MESRPVLGQRTEAPHHKPDETQPAHLARGCVTSVFVTGKRLSAHQDNPLKPSWSSFGAVGRPLVKSHPRIW